MIPQSHTAILRGAGFEPRQSDLRVTIIHLFLSLWQVAVVSWYDPPNRKDFLQGGPERRRAPHGWFRPLSLCLSFSHDSFAFYFLKMIIIIVSFRQNSPMERVLLLTQRYPAWFNSESVIWKVKTSLLKHTRTQVETWAMASVWVGWE